MLDVLVRSDVLHMNDSIGNGMSLFVCHHTFDSNVSLQQYTVLLLDTSNILTINNKSFVPVMVLDNEYIQCTVILLMILYAS